MSEATSGTREENPHVANAHAGYETLVPRMQRSVLHDALLIRGPSPFFVELWVPVLRRVISCRAAPGTRELCLFLHVVLISARRVNLPQYSAISENRKRCYISRRPALTGGRVAIVTNVGCGMRWTLLVREMMRTEAYGQAVWSCHLDAGVKFVGDDPAGDGG